MLSTWRSIEAAQTSLGWTLFSTQAKLRLNRTGPCAPGEPFGPDSAIVAYHRGPLEKALRRTEDSECPRLGE